MDKGRIVNLLKKTLSKDERVVFTYAYGSFVKDQSFKDIDIGIYVKNSEENPFDISSDIKTRLSHDVKREIKRQLGSGLAILLFV